MASTYRWIGGTSAGDNPASWELVAGPGNPSGLPDNGDEVVVNAGTVQIADLVLVDNTVRLGATSGVGGLQAGAVTVTRANPSVDSGSVITNAFVPASGAVSGALSTTGTFFNEGTVMAAGPAGSSITIDIEQQGTAPGLFFNEGQMSVGAGNTLTVQVGNNSAFINADAVRVDGGLFQISATSPNAIAGGLAPVSGNFIISGNGTLAITTGFPAGTTGQAPLIDFADGTGTLVVGNAAQFGGRINGFAAGESIVVQAVGTIDQVVYSSTTGVLQLRAGGATVSSLAMGTGMFSSGTFAVSGGKAGSFGITQAGTDVAITTTLTNGVWTNLAGGQWTTAANWSGGAVPGVNDTAQIGDGTVHDYVVQTGTDPVVVGSLLIGNDGATLSVDKSLRVATTTVQQLAGVIDVAAGGTLVVNALRQGGDAAELNLGAGSVLEVLGKTNVGLAASGGTLTTGGGNSVGLVINGNVFADGATINAGPTHTVPGVSGGGGFIAVGLDAPGHVADIEVTNASSVTATYTYLSSDPTSSGDLEISGVNTVWRDVGDVTDTLNTRGYMIVGANNSPIPTRYSSAAFLTITDGAVAVEASRALIGNTVNSEGSVVVSGGALWNIGNSGTNNNGVLRVGQAGIGSLRVLNDGTIAGNGGTVSVGVGNQTVINNGTTSVLGNALSVGANAGSFGTVVVAGSGSTMTTFGSNVVGDAGTGTLMVGGVIGEGLPDGGQFSSTGSMVVGNALGGAGFVRVGAGGTIALTGASNVTRMRVGNTVPSGTLAAIGQVEVAGTAALLTMDGGINIGRNGTGILTVADGGHVVSKTSDQTAVAALFVGQFGTGTVTVQGTGAELTSQGLAIIGRQGNGTLTVGNGATVTVAQDIAATPNRGVLQIGGGSSTTLGQQGGSGTVVVDKGGLLNVDQGLLVGLNGDQGVLTINGGSVTTGGSLIAGITSVSGTNVFDKAAGSIAVNAGGRLTTTGTATNAVQISLGAGKGASGALTVTGGTVVTPGQFLIGAGGAGSAAIQGSGTVAGVVTANGVILGGGSTGVGSLSIGVGGTLTDTSGTTIGGAVGSDGTIAVAGGTMTAAGFTAVGLSGTGTLSVSAGGIYSGGTNGITAGFNAGSHGTIVVNGGTLSGSGVTAGWAGDGQLIVSAGGSVDAGAGSVILAGTTGGSGLMAVSGGHVSGGGLTVGSQGNGSASLTGTSTASFGSGGVIIAAGTGTTGTLVVNASSLTTTGGLSVGDHGSGVLNLTNGGVVSAGTSFAIGIGGAAGASGTVTVSGATLNGTGVIVGNLGSGMLNINAGGLVDAGAGFLAIGFGSGAAGTVNVSGANARLVSKGLQMDASVSADATARLQIDAGATATVGTAFMGASSLIQLNGGLLDVDSLGIQAGATLVGFGSVDGSIVSSGQVMATGGTMEVTGTLVGASHIANQGTLKLDEAANSGITFDSGTAQVLMLQTPGTTFSAPLRGLFTNDVIQFNFGAGITIASATVLSSGSDIQITRSDLSTYFLSDVGFDVGSLTNLVTGFDGVSGNSFIQIGCFVSGTLIETVDGEVAVETLKEGDLIPTVLGGEAAPVVWLGRRHVDCDAQPDPRKVWPVRVAAHAFGPNLPRRELWLSPDHAIFVNDVLIPVIRLVNGTTIRQVPRAEVTYWHVQLPHHDVIRAEGLPAESFLDTEDRANFENGGVPMRLFPDFNARMWEAEGCAELVQVGPKLEAVRRMLAQKGAEAA